MEGSWAESRRRDCRIGGWGIDRLCTYVWHIPLRSNANALHLNAIAMASQAGKQGISHLLVAAVNAEVQRRGAIGLGLRALSTNTRAIRLYEGHGFILEG